MTLERQDINEDFYEADAKDIEFTIYAQDGSLKDLTNCELSYALFSDDGKKPGSFTLRKSSTDPTQIEKISLGKCTVHLLPTDTFNVYGTFRHQLHLTDANGFAGVVSSGKVQIFRSFARRPRNADQTAYLAGT